MKSHNSEGLLYQINEVTQCLDKGLLQSDGFNHKEMLLMHQIMDDIRKQIGVKYPQDSVDSITN